MFLNGIHGIMKQKQPSLYASMSITWLIKLGGAQNVQWVLRTLMYEEVKDWFEPVLYIHTLLSRPLTPVFYICHSSTH
jgi:hypothetical protein